MHASAVISSLRKPHDEQPAACEPPSEKGALHKILAILVLPLALGLAVLMFFATIAVALKKLGGRFTGRS